MFIRVEPQYSRPWLQLRAAAELAKSVTRDAVIKNFMMNVNATGRLGFSEVEDEEGLKVWIGAKNRRATRAVEVKELRREVGEGGC
jgi:hypothetical protein